MSTAFSGLVEGRSRAEFLAELVSLQDSIVVAGAHGKTTTAAMIAFVLERLGRDPGFLIGAEVPQLGRMPERARAGLSPRATSRTDDRAASPRIAVVDEFVDLDHHTEFASRSEVGELFERWLEGIPQTVWETRSSRTTAN